MRKDKDFLYTRFEFSGNWDKFPMELTIAAPKQSEIHYFYTRYLKLLYEKQN